MDLELNFTEIIVSHFALQMYSGYQPTEFSEAIISNHIFGWLSNFSRVLRDIVILHVQEVLFIFLKWVYNENWTILIELNIYV